MIAFGFLTQVNFTFLKMTTTTRSHSYTLPIRNDLAGQVYSSPEFPELRVTYVSAEAQRIHLQFNNTPIILDAKDITEGQAHLADDRYQIKVLK